MIKKGYKVSTFHGSENEDDHGKSGIKKGYKPKKGKKAPSKKFFDIDSEDRK